MHHVPGEDRNQPIYHSLEELVRPDSFARIIDAFVDVIDLESFGFTYFKLNEEGRPPYHPSVLMKLYLYGYRHGIRPCRALEEACRTNIEVMWLLEQRQPCYKTINNFRKENATAFREVFRRFVFLLKDWKLIKGKTIAIDSFKIRAQNSLKHNYNAKKIHRHLKYIDKKIAKYEALLEEDDEPDPKEIREKIEEQKGKKKQYNHLEKRLSESGDGQLSTTDPDARAVVFQRNSVRVGYNIQAASDAKYKLLIAMDTGDVNDTKALTPMVKQVVSNLSKKRFDVLGDKGYHSGRELLSCEQMGIKTYISPKESSSSKSGTVFSMDQFRYTPRTDTYTCPAGKILRSNGRTYQKKLLNGRKSYGVKHYKTKACKGCEIRTLCTQNKNGRVIERSQFQPAITRNNRRVAKNPGYYRQRQQLIEHQFGTLKRQRGFEYTLLRGKEKVLAEVSLAFTTYNLGRTVSILGFEAVLRRLKALLDDFLGIFLLGFYLEAHSRKIYFNNLSSYENGEQRKI